MTLSASDAAVRGSVRGVLLRRRAGAPGPFANRRAEVAAVEVRVLVAGVDVERVYGVVLVDAPGAARARAPHRRRARSRSPRACQSGRSCRSSTSALRGSSGSSSTPSRKIADAAELAEYDATCTRALIQPVRNDVTPGTRSSRSASVSAPVDERVRAVQRRAARSISKCRQPRRRAIGDLMRVSARARRLSWRARRRASPARDRVARAQSGATRGSGRGAHGRVGRRVASRRRAAPACRVGRHTVSRRARTRRDGRLGQQRPRPRSAEAGRPSVAPARPGAPQRALPRTNSTNVPTGTPVGPRGHRCRDPTPCTPFPRCRDAPTDTLRRTPSGTAPR